MKNLFLTIASLIACCSTISAQDLHLSGPSLPPELLDHIFKYLDDPAHLSAASAVSKEWKMVIDDDSAQGPWAFMGKRLFGKGFLMDELQESFKDRVRICFKAIDSILAMGQWSRGDFDRAMKHEEGFLKRIWLLLEHRAKGYRERLKLMTETDLLAALLAYQQTFIASPFKVIWTKSAAGKTAALWVKEYRSAQETPWPRADGLDPFMFHQKHELPSEDQLSQIEDALSQARSYIATALNRLDLSQAGLELCHFGLYRLYALALMSRPEFLCFYDQVYEACRQFLTKSPDSALHRQKLKKFFLEHIESDASLRENPLIRPLFSIELGYPQVDPQDQYNKGRSEN